MSPLGHSFKEALPPEVCQVIELFENELEHLHFPDVSSTVLGEHAAEFARAQVDAAAALQALEKAQAEVARLMELLAATASRGLAYASIYAKGDDSRRELAEKISHLASLPLLAHADHRGRPRQHGPDATAPKRRGRKPQASDAMALFTRDEEAAPDGTATSRPLD